MVPRWLGGSTDCAGGAPPCAPVAAPTQTPWPSRDREIRMPEERVSDAFTVVRRPDETLPGQGLTPQHSAAPAFLARLSLADGVRAHAGSHLTVSTLHEIRPTPQTRREGEHTSEREHTR